MRKAEIRIGGKTLDEIDMENMSEKTFRAFVDKIWPAIEKQFEDVPRTAQWNDYLDASDVNRLKAISGKWDGLRIQREVAERFARPIEIDGVTYKKVMAFPVLWNGWECDTEAWVIENEGQRFLELVSKAFIEGKIAEYQAVLDSSRAALVHLEDVPTIEPEPSAPKMS
jgi:hypothetical protein